MQKHNEIISGVIYELISKILFFINKTDNFQIIFIKHFCRTLILYIILLITQTYI